MIFFIMGFIIFGLTIYIMGSHDDMKEKLKEIEKTINLFTRDLKKLLEDVHKFHSTKEDKKPQVFENFAIEGILTLDDVKTLVQQSADFLHELKNCFEGKEQVNYKQYAYFRDKLIHFKGIRAESWRQNGRGIMSYLEPYGFETHLSGCEQYFEKIKVRQYKG